MMHSKLLKYISIKRITVWQFFSAGIKFVDLLAHKYANKFSVINFDGQGSVIFIINTEVAIGCIFDECNFSDKRSNR